MEGKEVFYFGNIGEIMANIAYSEETRGFGIGSSIIIAYQLISNSDNICINACTDIKNVVIGFGFLNGFDGSIDDIADMDEIAGFFAIFKDIYVVSIENLCREDG